MQFTLEEDKAFPLQDTGFSFNVARIHDGTLQTVDELRQIIQRGGPETIIVVQRKDLHPEFLQVVAEESRTGPDIMEDRYWKWNGSDGGSRKNAMPHMHSQTNCHIATEPTDTGTAFFEPRAFLQATREVIEQAGVNSDIRLQIQDALQLSHDPHVEPNVFDRLHSISGSYALDRRAVLECIAAIQSKIRTQFGQYDVDLGANGNALVVIPKLCLHGRSMANGLARSTNTAWRYFQS